MDQPTLPDFASPPVVETVLSTAFRELQSLNSARMGRFWTLHAAQDLPLVEERDPYFPPIERFDIPSGTTQTMRLDLGPSPMRMWLISHRGDDLLQLQRDWFAYNWRKVAPGAEYPRYPRARVNFEKWFSRFLDFVVEEGLGKVVPTQCELTYINHVEVDGLETGSQLHRALRLVTSPSMDWLPQPEGMRASTTYVIQRDDQQIGRLHVDARPGVRKEQPNRILRLELTARGVPLGDSLGGVLAFHDVAHEWIVRAFADLTTEAMHEKWERRR